MPNKVYIKNLRHPKWLKFRDSAVVSSWPNCEKTEDLERADTVIVVIGARTSRQHLHETVGSLKEQQKQVHIVACHASTVRAEVKHLCEHTLQLPIIRYWYFRRLWKELDFDKKKVKAKAA